VSGTSYGKLGIARIYALVFGIAYMSVALIEDIAGGGAGIKAGSHTLLKLTATQNVIHWVVGIAVLGSFFAGEAAAKMVARVVGVVFVVASVLGIVAREWTGDLLGFHGRLPWSYNLIHILTAILALFAGFAAERAYGQTAQAA
jgi:hypothetical protein